jgi:hypothetical protein
MVEYHLNPLHARNVERHNQAYFDDYMNHTALTYLFDTVEMTLVMPKYYVIIMMHIIFRQHAIFYYMHTCTQRTIVFSMMYAEPFDISASVYCGNTNLCCLKTNRLIVLAIRVHISNIRMLFPCFSADDTYLWTMCKENSDILLKWCGMSCHSYSGRWPASSMHWINWSS